MRSNFFDLPIAITDVETTGLDPTRHEIIELGVVVVDQATLAIKQTLELKITPTHIESADPYALSINGYQAAQWQEAVTLKEAMNQYLSLVGEAIFCAHNVSFDWSFISTALRNENLGHRFNHHRLDLSTIAWIGLHNSTLENFKMNSIAAYLGIPPEPDPHRAINGAMTEYQIFKTLLAHIRTVGLPNTHSER